MPCFAIIGRPNVGKSTLFNRLVGKRMALVHDEPGVTRDRRHGTAQPGPTQFDILDTPGLEKAGKDSLQALMTQQSLSAMDEADAILFVIDAKQGVTPEDERFATMVRKTGLPVILVANKAEAKGTAAGVEEGFTLGFGEPVAISAEHGVGMAELYTALAPYMEQKEQKEQQEQDEKPIRIALVGRPNVGKSTLMNCLLGEDRMLTGPYAGMTRDAIMVETVWQDRPVALVDTAGMRRKARVQQSLEKLSVSDTTRTIDQAELVILVLDATQPLEKQDNVIASLIEREGRACVIALNKWDRIETQHELLLEDIRQRLENVAPKMRDIQVVPLSAERRKGLDTLMDAVFSTYEVWNRRISTGELNRWLEQVLAAHTPPLIRGKRCKIRYITQAKSRPPTFILFVNRKGLPDSYIQYLRRSLREVFDLPGVPIRISLRTGNNPYTG